MCIIIVHVYSCTGSLHVFSYVSDVCFGILLCVLYTCSVGSSGHCSRQITHSYVTGAVCVFSVCQHHRSFALSH